MAFRYYDSTDTRYFCRFVGLLKLKSKRFVSYQRFAIDQYIIQSFNLLIPYCLFTFKEKTK